MLLFILACRLKLLNLLILKTKQKGEDNMSLKKLGLLSAALATTMLMSGTTFANTPSELEEIRDSYIFVFDNSVAPGQAKGLANRAVSRAGGTMRHTYDGALRGFSARMSATAAARLAANNPNIAYYEADQIMRVVAPPPGKGPGGGGGDTGGNDPVQETPWGITRVNGTSGIGLTAWVIDSGVDQDHADLNVDTARSANFITKGKDTKDDGNGHGTHVAGTIAAIDNDIGVIGVAAGASVVGIRVLDNRGSGSNSGVIAGVNYVAANCAPNDVANMSLGGGFSQALNDAVVAASASCTFVLAAGNESTSATTKSPASANGPNIVTVSAFAQGDTWASFSNYGNPPVDCAGPGVAVKSTYKDGGYATLSGTSMASPHVAGVYLLGNARADGTVSGDPDGNADTICVH